MREPNNSFWWLFLSLSGLHSLNSPAILNHLGESTSSSILLSTGVVMYLGGSIWQEIHNCSVHIECSAVQDFWFILRQFYSFLLHFSPSTVCVGLCSHRLLLQVPFPWLSKTSRGRRSCLTTTPSIWSWPKLTARRKNPSCRRPSCGHSTYRLTSGRKNPASTKPAWPPPFACQWSLM